jgi:chromosome segregation ATPase
MLKLLFAILLLLLFLSFSVSAREVYLSETEYNALMSIIKQSKANSEQQTELVTGLKETLKQQEAELQAALNAAEKSEADLTELKSSLAKIRSYSDELSEYCKTLEADAARLKRSNTVWKTGCGAAGGAVIALLILLCIL